MARALATNILGGSERNGPAFGLAPSGATVVDQGFQPDPVALGKPAELVRSHAGEEVLEVYGPPAKLAEASELAAREGWQSRRSGPALAIMRAESLDGKAPEGVRRPANLEDAFVALTGEEIE